MPFHLKIGRFEISAGTAQLPVETKAGATVPVDPIAAGGMGATVDWLLGRSGRVEGIQTPDQLLRKYAGWVYACASIGSATLAALPLKLYASRGTGEEKARCKSRGVSKIEDMRLRRSFAHKALVSQAEDIEEVLDHPLLDLLANVNPTDNAFDLKEQTSLFLDLTGNSLWYLKMGQLGQPEEIWTLQPNLVTLVRDPLKGVTGYLYGRTGDRQGQIKLTLDEVIHFRLPNPQDRWWGLGPVQAGIMAVNRANAMDIYEHATMKNMGRPDLAVIYKGGSLQEDDRRDLEVAWNNAYSGPDKAGKVKVMDENYEVKEFGWSPREMAFLQGRNWTLKEIAAMFPVPIALLDTEQVSNAPMSGLSGTSIFMARYNTQPRARRIEEKLNECLCPLYDERLFLAFDNPVPEDAQAELLADTSLLGSYAITINEVRGRRGMDAVEWGDKPWAPMGLQPLGTPLPAPVNPFGTGGQLPENLESISAGEEEPTSSSLEGATGSEEEKGINIKKCDLPGNTARSSSVSIGHAGELHFKGGEGSGSWDGPDQPRFAHQTISEGQKVRDSKTGITYTIDQIVKPRGGKLAYVEAIDRRGNRIKIDADSVGDRFIISEDQTKIHKIEFLLLKGSKLNGQLAKVMEMKRSVGKVAPLSKSERMFRAAMMDLYNRQVAEARKGVDRFVGNKGMDIIDLRKWTRETDQLTLPLRWHPFKAGGDEALQKIQFQLPEWIESKKALDALRMENFNFAREISKGTADRLKAELVEGMGEGESISELKNRIGGLADEWDQAGRAEMIARTESARAFSTGTEMAWEETDVVEAKVWLASSDACPFCLVMDGTEVELGEDFKELGDSMTVAGGGTMDFDYSAVGGPPLHPNCRCVLTAKLGSKRRRHISVGGGVELAAKGGEGSGNFGHEGRPGEVGGSGGVEGGEGMYKESDIRPLGWHLQDYHKIWISEGKAKLEMVPTDKLFQWEYKDPITADSPTIQSMMKDWKEGYRLPVIEGYLMKDGRYKITDGQKRWFAWKEMGHKEIPMIVTGKE